MPICTSCTHPTPFLYSVYNTANNLRLEQCPACHEFADPYVEHDTLTLLLDLILLKRDVFRHLLFNRGSGVRYLGVQSSRAGFPAPENDKHALERTRQRTRWMHILKLGSVLVVVDAFIRWSHLSVSGPFDPSRVDLTTWNAKAVEGFLRMVIGCIVETVAFHSGVTLASYIVLTSLDWARRKSILLSNGPTSGIRQAFRYSHIPLTLFYTSLTKLFLLFLLTIWRPASSTSPDAVPIAPQYNASNMFTNPVILNAIEILDEDKMDREWIVRNVLGGMAAGFGLRVVLDCPPAATTLIILTGWGVKTAVANVVSGWVGGNVGLSEETVGAMWLAYSIP
ncbi:Arv1-domain-containing protein [Cristinia sonorae]|uniref:Protein ARV n=1 Tax=Cristinia sonorae TaxID=1940300 RepID=A0A8K0XPY4_9AGAR|nr:Arv1-domain-containing protein [Cristinia sonorae]